MKSDVIAMTVIGVRVELDGRLAHPGALFHLPVGRYEGGEAGGGDLGHGPAGLECGCICHFSLHSNLVPRSGA